MARVTKKAVAVIAGVAAAASVLTACSATGTEGAGNPWPEVTATAPADPAPAQPTQPAQPAQPEEAAVEVRGTAADRQEFLSEVRGELPWLEEVSDQTILDLADAQIYAYESGVPWETLLEQWTDEGLPSGFGTFFASAVIILAPELVPQLRSDVASYDETDSY